MNWNQFPWKPLPLIDSDYVQFGSADWFWSNQVNSYVLQVEPDRYKHQDTVLLPYKEALFIEKIRNAFFDKMNYPAAKLPGILLIKGFVSRTAAYVIMRSCLKI